MDNISPIYKNLLYYNVSIQDYNNSQYIKVYDMPQIMGTGKHSFLLWINNSKFLSQSALQLEVLDSNGVPINYTIPPIIQGGMRRVSIDITDSTADGIVSIIFVGTIFDGDVTKMNNYRFITTTSVNKGHRNTSSIRFNNQPIIQVEQISKPLLKFITQYNGIVWNSNTTSSIDTIIDLNTYKTPQTISKKILNYNNELKYLTIQSGQFDQSFLNQKVKIYSSSNLLYQFVIADIINNSIVQVRDIGMDVNYIESTDMNNYTASIIHLRKIPNTNISVSVDYEGNVQYNSILNISITNFDTFSGKVGSIKTFYKKLQGDVDNYKLIGQNSVQSKNILISKTQNDILQGIGILSTNTSNHWYGVDISGQDVVDITQSIRNGINDMGQIIRKQEYYSNL